VKVYFYKNDYYFKYKLLFYKYNEFEEIVVKSFMMNE